MLGIVSGMRLEI